MRTVTVKQLIETLQTVPEDFIVVLSRDEEGNGFNAFSGDIGIGQWDPNTWDFTSYAHDEDGEEIEPTVILTTEQSNSVCLWP